MENMEIISTYTQAQAIEDGVLYEIPSKTSREAGFTFPVIVTSAVYAEMTPSKGSIQDFEGRLWDVLMMLRFAIARGGDCSQINFSVRIGRRRIYLKALCCPGDNMEPVITIMLPNED